MKPIRFCTVYQFAVALFVSAWIETFEVAKEIAEDFVALFVSAWIETSPAIALISNLGGRTLRECVD